MLARKEDFCIMLYGVHIMRETKSLVTTSVLYTIWEHEKKTFSDVLAEFVLYCLAHFGRGEIDINCLCLEITKEFGLDLPCAVCERILKRISKRNNYIVAKKNRKYFLLSTQIDVSALTNERNRTETNIKYILDELKFHLEKTSIHYSKSLDIEEVWSCFLEKYGYYYFKDTSSALAYTEKYDKFGYAVGNFILDAYSKGGMLWDSILQLLNGLMLAKVIVFEVNNDDIQKQRFNKVTFYLDTPILLGFLGFLSEYEEKSYSQMITILRSMGAKFSCFDEHYQEVRDILTAYINNRQNPGYNTRTLAGLDKKDLSREQLYSIRDTLSMKLESAGISISQRQTYDYVSGEKKNDRKYIDEINLSGTLSNAIPSYKTNASALKNDVNAISAIALLRDGRIVDRLERSIGVFVTSNTKLVRCATDFLTENPFKEDEIPLVLDDVYLTTHAWLKSGKRTSDCALLKVIANAMAAVRPSNGFRAAAIAKINKMQTEGEFSEIEAIIAQTNWMLLDEYGKKAEGDPNYLTDDMIKEAYGQFKRDFIDSEVAKIEKEQVNWKAERIRDEQRQQEVRQISSQVREKAQRDARFIGKMGNFLFAGLGLALIFFSIVNSIFGIIDWDMSSVISLFLGIISEIDFFISKRSFIKRITNKICMEVERFSYTKRMCIAGKYNQAIAAIESSKCMKA